MEKRVATKVLQRASASPITPFDARRLGRVIKDSSVELSPSQESALVKILNRGLSILTGGPGVGKTTMVRLMVRYWERLGFEPVLVAPTGRAAQRMEEACDRTASTLHRAMKYNPQKGFVHKEGFPLGGKVFICDEFSMVDLQLFEAFLEALPSRAQVILVGDRDQLPSVGHGRVLGDLLDSDKVCSAHLKEVFRQAGGSLLVKNSHRLIAGKNLQHPEKNDELHDFYFIESRDSAHTLQIMKKLVLERLPERFGTKATSGTQILSPIKKGPLGTIELNHQLQRWLNPQGREIHVGEQVFRVGDRVVQNINNYDLELYNGDLGQVVSGNDSTALIRFGDREVHYEQEALRDLSLSYALTVHKSQGSEYPYVVLPLCRSHRIMLHLELLYTAMTRARVMCVWIGQKDYLKELTTDPRRIERYTFLSAWLKKGGELD
jgi:exodeoxyribonuclease V alpha subunit